MGSTARRHGVYGGEYAPTGLRLFAWWKKNEQRRLQKPGSGSARIRSNLKPPVLLSFYKRRYLQNNFLLFTDRPSLVIVCSPRWFKNHLVHVIAEISIRIAAASNAGICWPAQEPKAHLGHAEESEAGRASHGLAASFDPRIDSGEPAPGRRSTLFFLFFFFFIYL
jgi:hypothetical protein